MSRERPEVREGQLQFLQCLVTGDVTGGRTTLALDHGGACGGVESWTANFGQTHLLLSFTHAFSALKKLLRTQTQETTWQVLLNNFQLESTLFDLCTSTRGPPGWALKMEALEEGECSEEGSSRANEEEEGKVEETGELEPAVEENKEENGVVLSVIQQELQSKQLHSPASHQDNCLLEDVSWPCSDGGQSEKQVRPIAGCGEEGEETQDKVSPETLEALGQPCQKHANKTRPGESSPWHHCFVQCSSAIENLMSRVYS